MHITRVVSTSRDVPAVAAFFRRDLDLPVTEEPGKATVQVGTSLIELEQDDHAAGDLHLAFNIPPSSFVAAKRWLATRAPLLTEDGEDEFEGSAAWNSRSLYFEAPDGTVLELIMRRDVSTPAFNGFGASQLLSVSEVGVAVPDVPDTVHHLHASAGLELYGRERPGEQFAPVGDIHGLLILVAEGRAWFPTQNRFAQPRPLLLEAVGSRPGNYRLTEEARLVVRATTTA